MEKAGAFVRPTVATTSGAHVGAPLASIRTESRIAPDNGESRKIASLADASDADRDLADTLRTLRAPSAPAADILSQIEAQKSADAREIARIDTARRKLAATREVQSAARLVSQTTAMQIETEYQARAIERAEYRAKAQRGNA